MELFLSVSDRINFSTFFPDKGDLISLRLIRDIKEKIDFTQEEIVKLNLQAHKTPQGSTMYTWNVDEEFIKSVEFTIKEIEMIQEQISLLDQRKEISFDILDLVEKIVDTTE